MMDPKSLCDLTARATHCKETSKMMLVLKSVIVQFMVITVELQIFTFTWKLFVEIIMMDPKSLCDLTARTTHRNETSKIILVLKSVIIHFMVITVELQIFTFTRCFKNISCPATKAGTASHFCMVCRM